MIFNNTLTNQMSQMDSKKIILAAICLFCTLFSGFAQQQVSGKVTDVTGEPVIGAGVVVESRATV